VPVPVDLEEGLERLYGVDLDDFVAERGRLARALRDEGRRAEATRVQEKRKPTLSAWTVNQLVRRRRKEIDLLLDAGHRLAGAQRALLAGGDPKAFDEARRQEQTVLGRLREEARAILGERASAGMLERVTSTLRAAAVLEEARPDLALGRLTSDVGVSGFEALTGAASGKPPEPAQGAPARSRRVAAPATHEDAARKEAAERQRIDRARARLGTAEARRARAAKRLLEAERAERDARTRLQRAERDAEQLRGDLQAAEGALEEARAELQAARRRA
jgi:hypothetical protein